MRHLERDNAHHRRQLAASLLLPILLAVMVAAAPGLGLASPQVMAHSAAQAYPPFQGPLAGMAGGQRPLGADFCYTCNAQASSGPVTAARATIAAGTAVTDPDNCGQWYLFLSAPGAGHFTASAALADDATIASGGAPALRIFVLASNGYTSRSLDVVLTKGTP